MPLFTVTGGMGDAVERWEDLTPAKVQDAALDAGEAVAKSLIGVIQERAGRGGAMPRWEHVAGFFDVVRTGTNVGVWIPPDQPESIEAHMLEYGQGDRGPAPVLRNSITHSYRQHSQMFSAELDSRLFGGKR